MYFVYKHTCPNNKIYVGITSNVKERWKSGACYLNNSYFQAAIQKYGWDNIKHEILFENLTKDEASQKEIELIAEYKSDDRRFGYNVRSGGESQGIRIIQYDTFSILLKKQVNKLEFVQVQYVKLANKIDKLLVVLFGDTNTMIFYQINY